jgi:hypothetical protein
MKLRFQRIKNQVNRRFLQAGMSELPKVARSEIFWTACKSGNKTVITPSFGLRLRWMSTVVKVILWSFQWNNIFVYVLLCTQGKIHEKEAAAQDENKIVEMRTTTMKKSLGNASIGPHEMKFRNLEQNKDPKSIGKRRHKLATSNARRC